MDNGFNVKVGEIEGPLDLILTLVEERKMHVSDVSLAKIADEFIGYIKAREAFPAGEAAQFLVVAATLLLLKSRALLPVLSLTDDEESDVKDLERRLALYEVVRGIARSLGKQAEGARLWFGGLKRDTEPVFAPSKDLTTDNLSAAMARVLMSVPKKVHLPEIAVKAVVSLEEMMGRLAERIEKAMNLTFKDFVGSPDDRREIVVGFLAMLELVKRGTVAVEQTDHFTEIKMEYSGAIPRPRYD